MKVGIIGATGWMGSALGRHLLSSQVVKPSDLVVLNRSGRRPEYFGHGDVVWAGNVPELVDRSEIVVISVRPEDWPQLDLRAPGRLVVSFMAKVGMSGLSSCRGRIVRAMPNAMAETGESYTPWFAAPDVSAADKDRIRQILTCIGTSDELDSEDHLDLMTALPGSGSAYPALMAAAMLDYARSKGLAEHIARRAVEATVCGGARMLAGRIETAREMVGVYMDYAGITAAGLNAAETAGFTRAVGAALDAALAASRAGSAAAARGDTP